MYFRLHWGWLFIVEHDTFVFTCKNVATRGQDQLPVLSEWSYLNPRPECFQTCRAVHLLSVYSEHMFNNKTKFAQSERGFSQRGNCRSKIIGALTDFGWRVESTACGASDDQ